jgi:pimeloyl-ACP methyl ester carboxylesterase
MTTTLTQPAAKPTIGAVLQAGAVGILIAAVLNLILYFLGTAIGALPAMSSMGQPITLVPVLSFTIGAGVVATLLYLVLTRFLAPGRANAVFLIVASLVLIGMAFTPVTSVVDPTVATVLVLETMHLAAALPPMVTLTRLKNAGQWPRSTLTLLLGLLVAGVLAGCVPVTPNATVPPLPTPAPSTGETSNGVAGDVTDNVTGEVSANGITVAYESFGPADGETILLIGGTSMQLVDWPMELVDALVADGYRVIRYDNRDVGLSTHMTAAGTPDAAAIQAALMAGEAPPLPYTMRDMAADAVGLLDALGIDRAHIVGISLGGAIAQLVAIDYPERTRSLTLLMADSANPALPVVARPEAFAGVPPQPPAGDRAAYMEWQVKTWQALAGPDYPTDSAILEAWAVRNYARNYDPEGAARQGAAIVVDRFDPAAYRRSHLGGISAPTVIVQGDADPIVPLAAAEELADLIPGADLRVIQGLGHDIPEELVPEIADAILAAAGGAGL